MWVNAWYLSTRLREECDDHWMDERQVTTELVNFCGWWKEIERTMLALHRLSEVYASRQQLTGVAAVVDAIVDEYCRLGDELTVLAQECLAHAA